MNCSGVVLDVIGRKFEKIDRDQLLTVWKCRGYCVNEMHHIIIRAIHAISNAFDRENVTF